jgi:hypothetical protein
MRGSEQSLYLIIVMGLSDRARHMVPHAVPHCAGALTLSGRIRQRRRLAPTLSGDIAPARRMNLAPVQVEHADRDDARRRHVDEKLSLRIPRDRLGLAAQEVLRPALMPSMSGCSEA